MLVAPLAPYVLVEVVFAWLVAAGPSSGSVWTLAAAALVVLGLLVACLTALVAFCNVGLTVAVDRVRQGDRPAIGHSLGVAVGRLPNVLALAALVGVTLGLPWLAERGTRARHRWRAARGSGATATARTYLAFQAAALEDAPPGWMLTRRVRLLDEPFDAGAVVRMGVLRRWWGGGFLPGLADKHVGGRVDQNDGETAYRPVGASTNVVSTPQLETRDCRLRTPTVSVA